MIKKTVLSIVVIFFSFSAFYSCNSGADPKESPVADSLTLARGEIAFIQNCSSCHSFANDGIGPRLTGLIQDVSAEWVRHFVRDPKKIIESGDVRAKKLFDKYHTIMPSFAFLSDEEINDIIAYIAIHKKTEGKANEIRDPNALLNPIIPPIPLSGLIAEIEPVFQVPASFAQKPLTRITKMDAQPGSGNTFILDLRGKLYKIENNKPTLYMHMPQLKPAFIDKPGIASGFGSFAFHPEFERNGLLYTTHTETAKTQPADFGYNDTIKVQMQWVLSEWKTDHPQSVPFEGKSRELLRINMVTGFHGMQEITFNPLAKPGSEDYGNLYIGIGDGGSVEAGFPSLVHSLDKIWGTIIRIDPKGNNSKNGQYGIPPTNPFVKNSNPEVIREIYAYGFRNPHRFNWSRSGIMLASNIGEANIESLNIILPGHDYGWPIREGTVVFRPGGELNNVYPLPPDDSLYHISYPVAEYDHDEGNAISLGYEYTGSKVPVLKGKYIFGDIANGRLFYVNMADLKMGSQAQIKEWQITLNGKKTTLRELCQTYQVDLRFGRDAKGELYIFSKQDGIVYRILSGH